jgi:putative protease
LKPDFNKQLELLAPAGNAAAALAAFDAGADAVYAGLVRFNARERSENFDAGTLGGVIEYAHRQGRRVYVTLNTVIKEGELADVAGYLSQLSGLAPDAVIVQDLGVVRMLREYFPQLNIHASTQMGIHNSAGMATAARLGVSRVIVERQVTLDELRDMVPKSPVDVEMFVHGSLCCSLSGQCLFSSWHGGSSGNRGQCKQPCRRRFYSGQGNGFFFSAQDLCMIEHLDEIRSLGVKSLKIEGRLRQPDYVKNVVSAYRLMLDTPKGSPGYGKRLGEARNLLSHSCGRKWSLGFYTKESAETLVNFDSLGASGMLCGRVEESQPNGFLFTATKRIQLDDRLRVQPQSGDEGPAFTVTKMFVRDRSCSAVRPGEKVFVCCDKGMPYGGLVFKIGETSGDYSARIAALPRPRTRLDLNIEVRRDKLTVKAANTPLPAWEKEWELTPAERHPLNAETLQGVFREADSVVFGAGEIEAVINGQFFVPAGVLKNVRREFWAYIKENLQPDQVSAGDTCKRFIDDYRNAVIPAKQSYPETVATVTKGDAPGSRDAVRAIGVYDVNKFTTEAILPEFCPENRLHSLAGAIAAAYERGVRRFRTPALYGLELLRGYKGIQITAGGNLPVANSMAVTELQRLGVDKVLGHIELEAASLKALAAHSPLPVELYRLGRPVLLITRAKIPVNGEFRDSRGNEFIAEYDRRDGLTRVLPKKAVSVPRLPDLIDFYDLTRAGWRNGETSEFNFNSELQ